MRSGLIRYERYIMSRDYVWILLRRAQCTGYDRALYSGGGGGEKEEKEKKKSKGYYLSDHT